MYKKAQGFALLITSFFFFSIAYADDTSSNPIFTAHKDKVTCVSVADPEDMPDGYFLLFDYSTSMGMQLGRPWSVVEKGKCYEIDHTGGAIYIIKGNEADKVKFKDSSLYKPDHNIEERGYNTVGADEPLYSNGAISQILPPYPVESNTQDLYMQTFYLPNIIPTKYNFKEGITYSTSMGYMFRNESDFNFTGYSPEDISKTKTLLSIVKDPRYNKQILDLYSILASGLTNILNSCDNRSRVEYQLDLQTKSISQIWKLKDGTVISPAMNEYDINPREPSIGFLYQIGCREAYKSYLETNQSTINTIDNIASTILKDNHVESSDQAISINESKPKIISFLTGTYTPEKLLADKIQTSESLYSFPDFVKIKSNVGATKTIASPIPSTVLEEPTPEKKMEDIKGSSNKFFKLYTMLPIIGLVIILVVIIIKRKNNAI